MVVVRGKEGMCVKNFRHVLPGLAIQLAYKFPKFRSNLVAALESNSSLEPLSQMHKFILEPRKSYTPMTMIVIDGLDQYELDGGDQMILSCLRRLELEIRQAKIKFLITGRLVGGILNFYQVFQGCTLGASQRSS